MEALAKSSLNIYLTDPETYTRLLHVTLLPFAISCGIMPSTAFEQTTQMAAMAEKVLLISKCDGTVQECSQLLMAAIS